MDHPADADATVTDAMATTPKTRAADSTLAAMPDLFTDDHAHAALIVHAGILAAVVEPGDLRADLDASNRAAPAGHLNGRTVSPDAPLQPTHQQTLATPRRHLAIVAIVAIVADDETLPGLVCLKQHGHRFYQHRPASPHQRAPPHRSGGYPHRPSSQTSDAVGADGPAGTRHPERAR